MDDIYIFSGILQGLSRQPGDLTGIPPGAFLYESSVWTTLCKEYGNESDMIADIGVKDVRTNDGSIV